MIRSTQAVIDVQADKIAVAERTASWLIEQLQKTTEKFSICLSGGQTPKLLYQTIAQPEFAKQISWSKVHLFWGDERFVPKSDDLSNYKMVKTALLDHISIPESNVHPINTEFADAATAALAYEKELQNYYGHNILEPKRFLFDVTLLGLGADGHIASLFPNNDVLYEQRSWARAVVGVKSEDRITLTYPPLQSSKSIAFLVTGAEKNPVIKSVINGEGDLPAIRLKPEGKLYWFLDQTAYMSGFK